MPLTVERVSVPCQEIIWSLPRAWNARSLAPGNGSFHSWNMCAMASVPPAARLNSSNAAARPVAVWYCGLTQVPSQAPCSGGSGPRPVVRTGAVRGVTVGGGGAAVVPSSDRSEPISQAVTAGASRARPSTAAIVSRNRRTTATSPQDGRRPRWGPDGSA